MATCTHTGPFDGLMPCTRTEPHVTGHIYDSGYWPDRHDKPGRGDGE